MLAAVSRVVLRSVPGNTTTLASHLAWAMRQRASPCVFFHRDFCRFGDLCKFSHADVSALPDTLPFHDRSFAHADAPPPPPGHSRMRVMSYNLLADHLAREHARELYNSSPRFALEWGYRRKLILREIAEYQPDVVCLQEVDHFRELQQGLEEQGYEGLYTQRTGDRQDGLATFWRRDVFRPVKQERIFFSQLGLKDNVAQVVVLQRRQPSRSSSGGSSGGSGSGLSGQKRGRGRGLRGAGEAEGEGSLPQVAVGNIHVLFNPRRGDIKLAQVRALFERVQQMSSEHSDVPAVVCGDFNSAAGSPIYQYISRGELDLSQHDRRRLSGQVEAQGKGWPSLRSAFLEELRSVQQQRQAEAQAQRAGECGQGACGSALCCAEGPALGSALAREPYDPARDPYSSLTDPPLPIDGIEPSLWSPGSMGGVLPPPPPPPPAAAPFGAGTHMGGGYRSSSAPNLGGGAGRPSRGWARSELQMVMGGPTSAPHYQLQQHSHSFISRAPAPFADGGADGAGALLVRSPLRVSSAYSAIAAHEPHFTTCHDKFIGTVDYIWYTPPSEPNWPNGQQEAASCSDSASEDASVGGAGSGAAAAGRGRFALRPLSVLQPPSLQSLRTGMPSASWPSDHVSLVADFALYDTQDAESSRATL